MRARFWKPDEFGPVPAEIFKLMLLRQGLANSPSSSVSSPPSIKAMVQAVPLQSPAPTGRCCVKLNKLLESTQCNLSTIGDAIQKDPDLTARLLRLANSPFFGFASRLSTVAEAVSLLGIQQIQDMITASSVLEQFKGVPDKFVNKHSFWRHSLAVGITYRPASGHGTPPGPSRTNFLWLDSCMTSAASCCCSKRPNGPKPCLKFISARADQLLRDAEEKILGYDHQQIAAELLQRAWSLSAGAHPERWPFTIFRLKAAPSSMPPLFISPIIWSTPWASDHRAKYLCRRWTKKPGATLGLEPDALGKIIEAVDGQILAVEEAFLKNGNGGRS